MRLKVKTDLSDNCLEAGLAQSIGLFPLIIMLDITQLLSIFNITIDRINGITSKGGYFKKALFNYSLFAFTLLLEISSWCK